jgi:transcriptional regulator with XRE-family HTH domain
MSRTGLELAFGRVVANLRRERGWSQQRLASAMGTTARSYVCHIESGERGSSLTTIERIAAAFDLTPSELLAKAERARRAS